MSQQQNDSSFSKGLIAGAIIGGAVGAITALLFAPKPGVELRRDIAEVSTELYDKASEYWKNVESHVGASVQNAVNEGRIKAQNIVESARKQADDLISNAEYVMKEARNKATTAKNALNAGAEAFRSELNANSNEKL